MKQLKILILAVLIFTGLNVSANADVCISGFGSSDVNGTYIYSGVAEKWIKDGNVNYQYYVDNYFLYYIDNNSTNLYFSSNGSTWSATGGSEPIGTVGSCTPPPAPPFIGVMTNASTTFGSFGSLMGANIITGVSNIWPLMIVMLGTFLAFVVLVKIQDFIMTATEQKKKKN